MGMGNRLVGCEEGHNPYKLDVSKSYIYQTEKEIAQQLLAEFEQMQVDDPEQFERREDEY